MQRLDWWSAMCLCAVAWGVSAGPCWAAPETPQKGGPTQTPDGAARAVLQAVLVENKPQALWTALPPKYQTDVKAVLGEFANKMDPELWNKSFVVLGKLAKVARDKKSLILKVANQQGAGPINTEELTKNWDNVAALLGAIANSNIKTVEGLKKADPEGLLRTTGAAVLKHALAFKKVSAEAATQLATFEKAKLTLVSSEGDRATIKLEGDGAEPMELTKVEGKWVPAALARDWDQNVASLKQQIAALDFRGEQKGAYLATLGMVEASLHGLLAAKDEKAFMAALAASPLGMFLEGGAAVGPPGFAPPDEAKRR